MNDDTTKILTCIIAFCLLSTAATLSYAEAKPENSVVSDINYLTDIGPNNPEINSNGMSNEIGIDGALSYVSDLSTYWNYTSLHYYRFNSNGTFGGRLNSAHRFGSTAVQYQAEAYPVLYQGAYAALTLGYANGTQTLFSTYQYRAEGYFPLPKGFEYSIGQGGQLFTRYNNKKIFTYTASLGRYFSHYYMWARPNYFTPLSDLYFELGLRRIFEDPNTFIGVKVGTGKLPDIGDLPPEDNLISLTQTAIGIGGQFLLINNLYYKVDLSYAHQSYQTGLIRNITSGALGLVVRFD